MYPVLYKVSYWAEDLQKELTARGIIYADNVIDATAKIADWYGENEISSITINILEYQLFEISEEEYNAFLGKY